MSNQPPRREKLDAETGLSQAAEAFRLMGFSEEVGAKLASRLKPGLTFLANSSEGLKLDTTFFDFAKKVEYLANKYALYGGDRKYWLSVIQKSPRTLDGSVDFVERNIEDVYERFSENGLTKENYLRAIRKTPELIRLPPETVIDHVNLIADMFSGLSIPLEVIINRIVKFSEVIVRAPLTVQRNFDECLRLFQHGKVEIKTADNSFAEAPDLAILGDYLARNPDYLTYGDNSYELRAVYGDILLQMRESGDAIIKRPGGKPTPNINVLSESRSFIEEVVARHYRHVNSDGGVSRNVPVEPSNANLYSLVKKGLFKSLVAAGSAPT